MTEKEAGEIKRLLAEIDDVRRRFVESTPFRGLYSGELGLAPLFPIASLTPGSECGHLGPIPAGSRFVCMVCAEFAGDFDPVFQGYPWYLPWNRPEPMPTFKLDRPSIPTHRHKGDVAGRVRDCASWLYRNCGEKRGKTVSLERACELAGTCPKNIRERHPGVVEYIEWLAGRNKIDRKVLKRYAESNNPATTKEAEKKWNKPVRPLIEITPMGEYREHGVRGGLSSGQENYGLFDAPGQRRKKGHRGAFDPDVDDFEYRQNSVLPEDVGLPKKKKDDDKERRPTLPPRKRLLWDVKTSRGRKLATVATFEHAERSTALSLAAALTAKGDGEHFVAMRQAPFPDDALGIGAKLLEARRNEASQAKREREGRLAKIRDNDASRLKLLREKTMTGGLRITGDGPVNPCPACEQPGKISRRNGPVRFICENPDCGVVEWKRFDPMESFAEISG